ncbi:MAG: adenosylmethionine--8-amino-7-oxononanoate transaminase [Candidatus Angelobacter sp. Gp1-AA117]|nr:MAG: adenosylmethionine--8-amino-7-oxononanoate transaminase [Candidatus Angelobacter sp. Gp1-AA117]
MSAATTLSIWHPFTQAHIDPRPLQVCRASGTYLYTTDGGRIIDAISSWWVNLHGHCHPRIANAIAAQAQTLDHVLLAGFSHPPVERLTEKLRQIVPDVLTNIFYSDDGSTAVEVALKLAVQYWANLGRPEKHEIVALEHAYHGDTAGAMSVSADSGFTQPFPHLRFPVHRVNSAYCSRCPVGKQRNECAIECLEALKNTLEKNSRNIAAVIVEPLLQGAGGMIVHPVEFLQGIRRLCDEYSVLLIADEVLTGFGRCGKMFACDIAGIAPDLMCLSKGITGGFLPLGATLCTESIRAEFVGPHQVFFHGHSYTANPLACAAAVANLEIFDSDEVWQRIHAITARHEQRLLPFRSNSNVHEVRQIGTIAAIELKAPDAGYFSAVKPRLYEFFLKRGVLLRPLGHVIYVLPPYCIGAEDLNYVYDVIEEGIELAAPR